MAMHKHAWDFCALDFSLFFKALICNQIQIGNELHDADVSYIDGFTTVVLFTKNL
jgi:hypothetical protein